MPKGIARKETEPTKAAVPGRALSPAPPFPFPEGPAARHPLHSSQRPETDRKSGKNAKLGLEKRLKSH